MAKRGAVIELEKEDGPWSTPDLFGHESAEEMLLKAHQSGRLPHAWLISGPRGIGKATLAYRFARYLQADALAPSGGLFGDDVLPASMAVSTDDPTFQQIAGQGHPGLVTVARSMNEKTKKRRAEIVVDDVRKMQGMFAMTSAQDSWRIAIIDAADEMTRQAANALLKILEEPPARSLLLLVAHAPGQVLTTIRSRCQHLRLRALNASDLAAVLAAREIEIPSGQGALIAVLSEGRPGHAINLMEGGGIDLYHTVRDLIAGGRRIDMRGVHALGDKVAKAGAGDVFRLFIELFEGFLFRLVRYASGAGEGEIAIPGESEVFASLASATALDQWIEVWENSRQLFNRTMAVNLDKKQAVIIAFNDVQKILK
jgi:DNA polymerase III subunit delta'